MTSALIASLLVSLGLTLVLELLFALVVGRRGKDLALVCLVNVVTNPAVVLLYYLAAALTPLPRALVKTVLELAAVLIEALYYKRYGAGFRRPVIFSLGANAFSFGIGVLLSMIGGT